jgi:hypothetical protein
LAKSKKMKKSRARALAEKRKRKAARMSKGEGKGNSRYARKVKLRRKGVLSYTSPFFNPEFHEGVEPRNI